MPTTTASSSPGRRWLAGTLVPALLAAGASGCLPPRRGDGAAGMMQLQPESPAHRAMQTRRFETADDMELLSASAAVLQDLGFQISESVREVGLLRAAKERSAVEYGQQIAKGSIFLLTLALSAFAQGNVTILIPTDEQQQINASLVARPLNDEGTVHEVRVLFYRLVWKGDGQSGDTHIPPGEQRMEMIRDANIYQQFFARLQKSVFLEEQKI